MNPFLSTELEGGEQIIYKFDNGYGASVVRHRYSYGGDNGLWELAVIKFIDDTNWNLTYDTPVTGDVIGYLEWPGVQELLAKIKSLGEEVPDRVVATNKPSWKDAPEWANWLAMDEDGSWHWFKEEPTEKRFGEWLQSLCGSVEAAVFPNWEETLEKRP